MPDNGIAKANDFKAALERSNVEQVVLPASGLTVLLCRPPVFAALAMGRAGTQLQARITDAKPEEIKTEDIEAFTRWLTETLTRLFVQPRFAAAPQALEIGLGDILIEDLKFIFRWLRGEVFGAVNSEQGTVDSKGSVHYPLSTVNCTEDLGQFPGGQGAAAVPGGSGEAQLLPSERASGAHGDAGLPAGLHRG
ncbi:MAG: hypothetical protein ABSF45_01640 [Terriglobia bacterium]|jgi:hypothetical protein